MAVDPVDCLVVGQGLAGTVLTWRLRDQGLKTFTIDRGDPVTASRIAAGLVTPITGKNLAKSWRLDTLLPEAVAFYEMVGRALGGQFFTSQPVLRIFKDAREREKWEAKACDPGLEAYVDDVLVEPGPDGRLGDVIAPWGAFRMVGGGWLDVPKFLDASRERWVDEGSFLEAEIDPNEVELGEGSVRWGGVQARRVVFCQGFAGRGNPFFDWIPFKAAKGEVLDLALPGIELDETINRSGWLLPLGEGRFRAGSTYSWHALDCVPSEEAKEQISGRVKSLIGCSGEVLEHRAAVRPIIRESKLLMGFHASHPTIGFLNGLGSKGVLTAPYFARQLAESIAGYGQIDYEVDLCKNF